MEFDRRQIRRPWPVSAAGLALLLLLACTTSAPVPVADRTSLESGRIEPSGYRPFSPATSTVILIGIDALGWDFAAHTDTPALDRLRNAGATTERLIPSFPTKTFPNFYTLATGLFPGHHGLIANNIFDPEMPTRFALSDRAAVGDGRWYGGEPIWVTAERQEVRTAAFFWPGTEAEIAGYRPSDWHLYDGAIPNSQRVDQLLDWLRRPVDERPRLLTLYFSTVDDAAHAFPPGSPEVDAAVRAVDGEVGRLIDGLNRQGLFERTHIVIASDHGMAATSPERVILIDDLIDPEEANIIDWNPVLALHPAADRVEAVYAALAGVHPHLQVYRRSDLPTRFHYSSHPRIPPIIAIADEGWSITSHRQFDGHTARFAGGNHGYDNRLRSMGATLIAAGPGLRRGVVSPPLENIHLYSLLCYLLGIEPAANDGDLSAVASWLRTPLQDGD